MSELPRQAREAIEQAVNSHFWGTVELRFQDGHVVFVTQTKTTKIEDPMYRGEPYDGKTSSR